MRIVFFTDHFAPEISAPAAHIFDRCKIWIEQGHDVTVITNVPNYPLGEPYRGYKNRIRKWDSIEGIKVLRVGTFMAENKGTILRTLDYISFAISSFLNSLFLRRPDVVYSTSPHIFAPLGAIGFAWLKRVPHVLEVRDLWPESIAATTGMRRDSWIYKIFLSLEMFIYRSSKKIVVFTYSFKSHVVSKGIASSKLEVVINGANTMLFGDPGYDIELARELGLQDKFVVAYFGTHGLSHGLLNAIRAAALVKDDGIFFLFVGEGAEKKAMMALAEDLGVTNVCFMGQQLREEIPKFWGICNVGLVHLKNDPVFKTVIPSKIFEAMAAGRPVIYSGPVSDGSNLILEHQCGLVTRPDDPEDLAVKINELKNNSELATTLASNAKKASPNFSRERQATKTLDVLKAAANLR